MAGADMVQVPFSALQQENAPLLVVCALSGAGTLIQSALCQGWLTDVGVDAARLLLSSPRRVPPRAPSGYPVRASSQRASGPHPGRCHVALTGPRSRLCGGRLCIFVSSAAASSR
jgi:hypothetical protein